MFTNSRAVTRFSVKYEELSLVIIIFRDIWNFNADKSVFLVSKPDLIYSSVNCQRVLWNVGYIHIAQWFTFVIFFVLDQY